MFLDEATDDTGAAAVPADAGIAGEEKKEDDGMGDGNTPA